MRIRSAALAAGVVSVLAAAPAGPAAAAPQGGGLTVTSVRLATDGGGYPTISWGLRGLLAGFADATPDDSHTYVLTAVPQGGGAPITASVDPYDGWDGSEWAEELGVGEDLTVGETYVVRVEERAGGEVVETSAEVPFTLAVMDHPSSADLRKQSAGRPGTVAAGSVVRIRWSGTWEAGTSLSQVGYAPPRRGSLDRDDVLFCEGGYCPTRHGVQWLEGGTEPVTRFRVPARFAGRTLTVASFGTLADRHGVTELQWGWEWSFKVRRG